MRHRSSRRKLNITDGGHRRALFRNLGNALILHERIVTTLPRAKELRRYVEPLITLGGKPSVANRRRAFARLRDRSSVSKLFDDLGMRFAARPGGYLRILKKGFRNGDNAPLALVELTERSAEETAPATKSGEKKSAAKAKIAAKNTAKNATTTAASQDSKPAA